MIADYKVITKSTIFDLESDVKYYLQKGYKLVGSVAVTYTGSTKYGVDKFSYTQAMILEEEDEIIEELKKPTSGRCWDCKKLATCNSSIKSPTSSCSDFEAY